MFRKKLFVTFVPLLTPIFISYEKIIASHADDSAACQCAESSTRFRFG